MRMETNFLATTIMVARLVALGVPHVSLQVLRISQRSASPPFLNVPVSFYGKLFQHRRLSVSFGQRKTAVESTENHLTSLLGHLPAERSQCEIHMPHEAYSEVFLGDSPTKLQLHKTSRRHNQCPNLFSFLKGKHRKQITIKRIRLLPDPRKIHPSPLLRSGVEGVKCVARTILN